MDPPTERLRRAEACTPARPRPVPPGRQHAGAGVLPAAHRWRHGRRPVLRAVRSSGFGMTAGVPARAPLAVAGVNPARFAPRRFAAGCAGGLPPATARGSGSKSPRHVVRTAPFPTGAGSRRGGAIRRPRSRATATPAPAGGASGEGRGRPRPGGSGTPPAVPAGDTASKGGAPPPLDPRPGWSARAGQPAAEWSHTGAIAPRPWRCCTECKPSGDLTAGLMRRRGRSAPAIAGNGYASPGRRGLGAGSRQAPAGRSEGRRQPAAEWSHTGAIAPRPWRCCAERNHR